jgi:multidrug efflux pump subunit AcrB
MPLPEIEARVAKLREKFLNHPEARIEVKQFEQGPPIEAPIAIRVFGENLDSLRALAGRVTEVLKQTPGTLYIDNPLRTYKTDLKVDINREKAAMLGIPTAEIDRSVRLGLAGLQVANYKDQTDENRAVSLKVPTTGRPTVDAFDKVYISSMSGALVPLSQLTRLKFESSVPTINHYNKNRYVTVTSYVQQGYNTQEVTGEVLQQLDKMTMPSGFKLEAAGEVESSKESFGGLGTIILITVFGFLAILLLEFGTFKSTLIVLSVIPLGIIGAVLALLFTGNTLSFVAVVGIIALAGIEVKNSILLVDYTNLLRSQGKGLDEAIEEAGETRFLPIILTTMTAIGGLIPLVLENNPLYSPLAWVLIGGLIVSTLLTRLVTPVMYRMLAPKV